MSSRHSEPITRPARRTITFMCDAPVRSRCSRRRGRDPAMPGMIETRALRKVYPATSRRRVTPPRGTATPSGGTRPASSPQPSGEIAALDGLDLEVHEGEFFGLLGPNGAGKTTTIGVLTTRVLASSGEAFVAGKNVATEEVAVRRRIGVVPQRPNP